MTFSVIPGFFIWRDGTVETRYFASLEPRLWPACVDLSSACQRETRCIAFLNKWQIANCGLSAGDATHRIFEQMPDCKLRPVSGRRDASRLYDV